MALSTTACATRANSAAPVSISASEYSNLACQDACIQSQVAQEKEFALGRRQNNAATADAAFLFLLRRVRGGDVSGELAPAKGGEPCPATPHCYRVQRDGGPIHAYPRSRCPRPASEPLVKSPINRPNQSIIRRPATRRSPLPANAGMGGGGA